MPSIDFIKKRINFYLGDYIKSKSTDVVFINKISRRHLFSLNPILCMDAGFKKPWYALGCRNIYYTNDNTVASACDSWHAVANHYNSEKIEVKKEFDKFCFMFQRIKQKRKNKVYVIGTGPSAASAASMDWSDGYVFSCNTIVKDKALFEHIAPDLIVGNDPIYHFGDSCFAKAYQKDVCSRMRENSGLYFIYPASYYSIANKLFFEFKDRIIGIPHNMSKIDISISLLKDFSYPRYRNALIHQLLPLACTFSDDIYLWGFDGRAPSDKLFWSNAAPITYSEHLPELIRDNPAFFDEYTPKDDPGQYARMQNDMLTEVLAIAESKKFHFTMMHKSWTPILQTHFEQKL